MATKTSSTTNTHPRTMRAWQYSSAVPNLETSLHLNDRATPPPAPAPSSKELLVEVLAMSLNPADYSIAETAMLSYIITPKPASPGLDFCGRVAATPNPALQSGLMIGDLVVGRLDWIYQHGTLAQYTLAHESGVARLPNGVSVNDAAAIGTGALTAYQSLVPWVKKGDKIFVNGGSGGVGTFTIQIAKLLGCYVVVSCSGANTQLCLDLGADEVIDYKVVDVQTRLISGGKVFDHVVDNVGSGKSTLYRQSRRYLKPGAKYAIVGAQLSDMLFDAVVPACLQGRWRLIQCKNDHAQLVEVAEWVARGRIKVVVDSVWEFDQAKEAYARLKTGRCRGNVVVMGVETHV